MSVKLTEILTEIVSSSAPAELKEVKEDLAEIVPQDGHHIITDCLNALVKDKGLLLSDALIASKETSETSANKYRDYVGEKSFAIDFESFSTVEKSSSTTNAERPHIYQDLVAALEQYGEDYYPSQYGFTVIPHSKTRLEVVIIGQKNNKSNFYAGVWKSVYTFEESGKANGHVKVDIHYYEDGNVRLGFDEACEDTTINAFNPEAIINYIRKAEAAVVSKILSDFALLNQKYFKNLRRLLPVTKSKVNWGKAIGTYRLGSDVVDKS